MTPVSPSDVREPDPEALQAAREAVDALPRRKDQLLPALHAAQHAIGWLPRPAIEHVHRHTRVPVSEVYATATAYSELRLEPPVPGRWHVCTGVACDLAGAGALLDAEPDRTDRVDCQFLCALAPVVVDDGERLHGRLTPGDLSARIAAPAPAASAPAASSPRRRRGSRAKR
jgi:NADH:ubiquinone oxidoreductase subunit E